METTQTVDIKWFIRHPSKDLRIECETFHKAMELFEGFNVPFCSINGVDEAFDVSVRRVQDFIFNSKRQEWDK